MKPILYIVATPIGNLEDITLRALRILREEVDIILCEDTRTTRKLLSHYDITTKTESYHAHSSDAKEISIIERIQEGTRFALVSDAGTPTISDPGVKLISVLRERSPEIIVQSIPGASALITALSVTGFNGNQFAFFGFLPHKKGRNKIFDEIEENSKISIFYESPHRLMKTLSELDVRFSESKRKIAVGRELTKMFEETVIGTSTEVLEFFTLHPDHIRGECVVIIDK